MPEPAQLMDTEAGLVRIVKETIIKSFSVVGRYVEFPRNGIGL